MTISGASSLHPKIPFPATVVEREVRARLKPYSGFLRCRNSGPWAGALTLFRIKSERLKLPAPFGRRIAKCCNSRIAHDAHVAVPCGKDALQGLPDFSTSQPVSILSSLPMPLNRNPSAPGKLVSDIDEKGCHVRSGSKAALTAPKSNFRFTPESGLRSDIAPCPKSANIRHRIRHS